MDPNRPKYSSEIHVGSPTSAEAELRSHRVELNAERSRILRQRRVHLILFALAVSLPFHIAIIMILANIYRAPPPSPVMAPVVLDLSILPDIELDEMQDRLDSEDMLTLEPAANSGGSSDVSEDVLSADLPSIELASSEGGSLDSVAGGEVGEGLGSGLGAGSGSGASFFGVQAGGNRIAYILDVSGSMRQQGKMSIAMSELKRSLRALPDYASFVVVLYSDQANVPSFQRSWLRASGQNIKRVENWIDNFAPGGGTLPEPAFTKIFAMDVRPDSIFFMTDGLIPPETVSIVSSLNNSGKRVLINTIAFGNSGGHAPLRRMASDSDGVFRFVPVGGMR